MQQRIGRHVFTGEPIRVDFEYGRIAKVEVLPELPGDVPDQLFLAPGLIDIQVNGFAGVNFADPGLSVEEVRTVARTLWSIGVTHFLPTLITDEIRRTERALVQLARSARHQDLGHSILGFHLEGPFLSHEDGPRGAHPIEHCIDPDWNTFCRLQEAAENRIRLITLAPERPGAIEFIQKAVRSGVRVAIGHTSASREAILDAVEAGATLSTHLGNAAHDRLQRHHNYVYDQLGEDRLFASLIADGHHLPPHVVKIFLRAKGLDRTILTSDAVQYAGLSPGLYDAGYRTFQVDDDGAIRVVGEPRLAGSGLMLNKGVENLMRFTGVPLADAVQTVTSNPARFLGVADRIGTLQPGSEASFVRLLVDKARPSTRIAETIVAGQVVHQAN